MIIPDTNVLVYAVNSSSLYHRESRRFLDRALSGDERVGFVWLALMGFVRVTTSTRAAAHPLSTDVALDAVDAWLGAPASEVLAPDRHHAERVRGLLAAAGVGGNLVSDAHIAALALAHKATVVTYDSDFGRFPGVRWRQP